VLGVCHNPKHRLRFTCFSEPQREQGAICTPDLCTPDPTMMPRCFALLLLLIVAIADVRAVVHSSGPVRARSVSPFTRARASFLRMDSEGKDSVNSFQDFLQTGAYKDAYQSLKRNPMQSLDMEVPLPCPYPLPLPSALCLCPLPLPLPSTYAYAYAYCVVCVCVSTRTYTHTLIPTFHTFIGR
jgi:hypothetical protein